MRGIYRLSLLVVIICLLFLIVLQSVSADTEDLDPMIIPYYVTEGNNVIICEKSPITTCIDDSTSFFINYSYENWSSMIPLQDVLDLNDSYDSPYFCKNLALREFTHDADPTYVSMYKTESKICNIDDLAHNIKVIDYNSQTACVSIVIDGAISNPVELCSVGTTRTDDNSVSVSGSDTAHIQWTGYSANKMTFKCDSDERLTMTYTSYSIMGGCLDKYDAVSPQKNWTYNSTVTIGKVNVTITENTLSYINLNKTVGETIHIVADIRYNDQAMTNSTVKFTMRDPTGSADMIAEELTYDSDYNSDTHDQYLLTYTVSESAPVGIIELEAVSEYGGEFYVGGSFYFFKSIPFALDIKLDGNETENRTFHVNDQVAINLSTEQYYGEITNISAWLSYTEENYNETLDRIDKDTREINYTFSDNRSGNITLNVKVTHSTGYVGLYTHELELIGYSIKMTPLYEMILGNTLTFDSYIQNSTGLDATILHGNINATIFYPNGSVWTNATSTDRQIHTFTFATQTEFPIGNYTVEVFGEDKYDNIYNTSTDVYFYRVFSNKYINVSGDTDLYADNISTTATVLTITNIAEDKSMITGFNASFTGNFENYNIDGNLTNFSNFISVDYDVTTLNYNAQTPVTITFDISKMPLEAVRNNLYILNLTIYATGTALIIPLNIHVRLMPTIYIQTDPMNISLSTGITSITKIILINNTGDRPIADPVLMVEGDLRDHMHIEAYSNVSAGDYAYYNLNFSNITTATSGSFWFQMTDRYAPTSISQRIPVNITVVGDVETNLTDLSSDINSLYEEILILDPDSLPPNDDSVENITRKIKVLKERMESLLINYSKDVDSGIDEMQNLRSEYSLLVLEYEDVYNAIHSGIVPDPRPEPISPRPTPPPDTSECVGSECDITDSDNNDNTDGESSSKGLLITIIVVIFIVILIVILATSIVPDDSSQPKLQENEKSDA